MAVTDYYNPVSSMQRFAIVFMKELQDVPEYKGADIAVVDVRTLKPIEGEVETRFNDRVVELLRKARWRLTLCTAGPQRRRAFASGRCCTAHRMIATPFLRCAGWF